MVNLELLKMVAVHDVVAAAKRRIAFEDLFNRADARAIAAKEAETFRMRAHAAVSAELAHPQSAVFLETFVRQCSDGMIRTAGLVQFRGEDAVSRAGYLVEYDARGRTNLLELIVGYDPVSLKSLPLPALRNGARISFKIEPSAGLETNEPPISLSRALGVVALLATAVALFIWFKG